MIDNNFKVLIIEDEEMVAVSIEMCVLSLGYIVTDTVNSAKDAIISMQENQADIIISDIKIKGLVNGTQVCDELHLKYKTPIIFLSAYDNDDFLINAQKSDPIGYLIKPFREDELEALLKLASLKVVQKNRSFIKKDDFVFDIENNKLYKNDIEIKLTSNENDLLSFVIDASPNIVGYKYIIEQIW
jgi:DNA-binding response OmpR family regulator